jgi:transcriptional regulator with XRE-family HTH domain
VPDEPKRPLKHLHTHVSYSTQKDLAEALGVTASVLSSWKRRGCPVESLNLKRVQKWRDTHLGVRTRLPDPETASLSQRIKLADAAWKEAKAKLVDYELACEQGRLIYAEDSQRLLDEQAKLFRQELTNMPQVWAEKLLGKQRDEAVQVLTEIAHDILGRLYQ